MSNSLYFIGCLFVYSWFESVFSYFLSDGSVYGIGLGCIVNLKDE